MGRYFDATFWEGGQKSSILGQILHYLYHFTIYQLSLIIDRHIIKIIEKIIYLGRNLKIDPERF